MFTLRHLAVPLLLSLALVAGCSKKFNDDSKVLATVNGDAITEKDYENYLQLRSAQQGPVADKEKEKKVVLDEMIDRVLLTQQATEQGLEQTPDIHFRLKRVRENLLAQEVIRAKLKDLQISDDDVKKRFAEELEKTDKKEYKVRHILVKTEDEAKNIQQQLKSGKKFDDLAKASSLDVESGKRGGDLGNWVNQGSGLVPEFFSAVTGARKGVVTEPVKTEFGYHLIKVDDTRALKLPTVDEFMADPRAPANLRRRIQEERLQSVLKELRDKAKVNIK